MRIDNDDPMVQKIRAHIERVALDDRGELLGHAVPTLQATIAEYQAPFPVISELVELHGRSLAERIRGGESITAAEIFPEELVEDVADFMRLELSTWSREQMEDYFIGAVTCEICIEILDAHGIEHT